ncbi:MAG TPA: DUF6273 domain-containing protein [Bacilli bacterium]|nr:DUF6273 domain-containing protein [Bacilli bacterium]
MQQKIYKKRKNNNKKINNNFINKKLIILLNIIFLAGCCIFYGSRLIYFYKIENPKIKKNETLFNVLTLKKNIVTIGEGLYKNTNNYVYKGKKIDNYVKCSGRIWRVVSIDEKNIKLITDSPQTSLVWGVKTDYENSQVRSWLNSDQNTIKSFYQSLTNTAILAKTKTCIDTVDEKNITCEKTIEDNVGLLSAYEYNLAGGENSYLNINSYFWTSSIDKNSNAWYVYSKGTLNNTISSGKTYYAYGVRPTITIKGDTKINSGDGTLKNPYNLDNSTNNVLNNKYVGDYVKYNNYNWRIIEIADDYVKLAMDGVIKVDGKDYYTNFGKSNYMNVTSTVGSYLNKDFYNSLENKDLIIKHQFNMGRYDKTYKYDFNKITEYKEEMNIGLLQLGELFVNDVENYFLSTRTITSDGTIYEVLEDGKIYAGSLKDEKRLRPVIHVKPDVTVNSGSGTKEDPYMIG